MEKNQKPKTEGDKQAEEKIQKWLKDVGLDGLDKEGEKHESQAD